MQTQPISVSPESANALTELTARIAREHGPYLRPDEAVRVLSGNLLQGRRDAPHRSVVTLQKLGMDPTVIVRAERFLLVPAGAIARLILGLPRHPAEPTAPLPAAMPPARRGRGRPRKHPAAAAHAAGGAV